MFPFGSPVDVVPYPLAVFVVGLCLTSPRSVAWILQLGGLASQGPLPFVHYLALLATGATDDSRVIEVRTAFCASTICRPDIVQRAVNDGRATAAGEDVTVSTFAYMHCSALSR